ncbi:hypothetical protein [Nocardioides sp.]|uniref:hypothetical protein n=1 Tax=Nocardioides sp. TaxID=35761 RepID=UPI0035119C13
MAEPGADPTPDADPGQRGSLVIADRVVTRVAGQAAREVAHVAVVRPRRPGGGSPRVRAVVAGGRSRIALDIATAWPQPTAAVAAQVRATVAERVGSLVGVVVDGVDVRVTRVVHVPNPRRRVE